MMNNIPKNTLETISLHTQHRTLGIRSTKLTLYPQHTRTCSMYCDIMAFAMSEYLRVTFGVNLRAELSSF